MVAPTALNKRGTKVSLDGYTFDSQKEADFYMRFVKPSKLQYTIHPRYVLSPLTQVGNVKVSQIAYKPDFVIYNGDEIAHVYDVKNSFGVYGIDASVKLRFKLFLLSQGIPVEAVVVRKHDFKVIAQGITKQRKPTQPFVCNNLQYDWIEATNV
ncbi:MULTISPECIES: DUF1064 domain-containing protein [unclassified Levilactobacillus]|uniref:DUF1064 domain-containing protein n=1 Tax=unclassified Levilactobacillus TaxID=2767918 RepID=UPI002FF14D77